LGDVEGGEVPVEEGSVVRGGTVFMAADISGVHVSRALMGGPT
jgi:hypothetical protein